MFPHTSTGTTSPITTAADISMPASPQPFFRVNEARAELRRLCPGNTHRPEGVCPTVVKGCVAELVEPVQTPSNLSLQYRRVLVLWKTLCPRPVPKAGINKCKPVDLKLVHANWDLSRSEPKSVSPTRVFNHFSFFLLFTISFPSNLY